MSESDQKDRPDSSKPRAPREFPRIATREVGHAEILSARDLQALGKAFAALGPRSYEAGGLAEPLMAAIEDLAALDRTSLSALNGSADAGEVRAMVADFVPWPRSRLSNRPGLRTMEPVLKLRSPGAPLVAAFLAGESDDEGRSVDEDLPGRTITAFLWRAEPVARVVLAARALADGTLDLDRFEAIAGFAAHVLRGPLKPEELVKGLQEGLTLLPAVWPVIDPPGTLPRRPPFDAWLLPENQAWGHCAMGIRTLFRPLPDVPKTSPPPGVVKPATICPANIPLAGLEITISGSGFGAQGLWGISVNGVAATIISWTATEIRLRTSTYQAGCNRLHWTYEINWTFDDEGVGAACGEALRIPPIDLSAGAARVLHSRTRFWTDPGQFNVIAPRIARFAASAGTGGAKAAACSVVVLDWMVDQLPCAGNRQLISIRLLRDGQQIARPFLLTDSFPDATEATASYSLEVTGRDAGGAVCSTLTQTLTVERLAKAIELQIPPELMPGAPREGVVTLSCPAPSVGVVVTLTADIPARLVNPATVSVSSGATEARFQIATGTECGAVVLSATAPGHTGTSASTCVIRRPVITAFNPPAGLKACVQNSLSMMAGCVTSPPALRAVAIDSAGSRTPLSASVPNAQSCGRSATVTLSVPPLTPGVYSVEISDRGGTAVAASTFTLDPNPRVVSAPTNVSRGWACPSVTFQVEVDVEGADSAEATLASNSTTAVVMRPSSSRVCSRWTARFSFTLTAADTVSVVAISGAVRSPASSAALRLNFTSNVVPAIRFIGTMQRTLKIWRRDLSAGQFTDTGAAVTQGATTTFPLALCESPWLRLTEGDANSGENLNYTDVTAFTGHPDAPPMQPDQV